jgi:hypothetical protein
MSSLCTGGQETAPLYRVVNINRLIRRFTMDNTCVWCGFRSDNANSCLIDGKTIDPDNACNNGCFYDEENYFTKTPAVRARVVANVRNMVGS